MILDILFEITLHVKSLYKMPIDKMTAVKMTFKKDSRQNE